MSYEALNNGHFGWDLPAWIDAGDGSLPRPCKVRDLSNQSATLIPVGGAVAPNRFLLRLNSSGSLVRKCAVVGRGDTEIRVAFF